MKQRKGIILAGGRATRLYPVTQGVCKQLLPIYDKPMVYYPLSTLMLAGIREILLITTRQALPSFRELFGDGRKFGLDLSYEIQESPRGLADAFLVAERFLDGASACLVLGDNILYGHGLNALLAKARTKKTGATIFGYAVKDPARYGVVTLDAKGRPISVVEKPKVPKSPWVVPGIYFFDEKVVSIAKKVKPSGRGELEITDVINAYLRKNELSVELLGRGYAWLDAGTYESLLDASSFIRTIEERQGLKIGCVEEVAFRQKWIKAAELKQLAATIPTSYGEYLRKVAGE